MSPSGSPESYGDNHFLELYKQAGYQPNILFRSSDTESILMMIAAEEGISIMPSYVLFLISNQSQNLISKMRLHETDLKLSSFCSLKKIARYYLIGNIL